jgi:hypothetical protein
VPPVYELPHAVIDPSALRAAKALVVEPMVQSRRGVMESTVCPLVMAIPRFIQIHMPLPPLKPMGQS